MYKYTHIYIYIYMYIHIYTYMNSYRKVYTHFLDIYIQYLRGLEKPVSSQHILSLHRTHSNKPQCKGDRQEFEITKD
jgi:hypothetical protein